MICYCRHWTRLLAHMDRSPLLFAPQLRERFSTKPLPLLFDHIGPRSASPRPSTAYSHRGPSPLPPAPVQSRGRGRRGGMHAGPSRPPPVQRESYADTPQPRFRTTSDHYVPSGYGDEERTQKRPRLDTRLTPVIPQRQYPEQPPSPSPQPRTSTSGRVAHAPPMIYTPVLTHPPAYIGRNPLPPQDERFRQDTNPPREHDRYRPGETRLRQPSGEVDAYSGSGYAHASTLLALHHVLIQLFVSKL